MEGDGFPEPHDDETEEVESAGRFPEPHGDESESDSESSSSGLVD